MKRGPRTEPLRVRPGPAGPASLDPGQGQMTVEAGLPSPRAGTGRRGPGARPRPARRARGPAAAAPARGGTRPWPGPADTPAGPRIGRRRRGACRQGVQALRRSTSPRKRRVTCQRVGRRAAGSSGWPSSSAARCWRVASSGQAATKVRMPERRSGAAVERLAAGAGPSRRPATEALESPAG